MTPAASTRAEVAALAALTLAPLLPFLGGAVSLDAPVFLAVARQILRAPGDPYGFEMIWDPTSPRVAEFNLNPPLLSYYLAPWIALAGEREALLHAVLLPFPLLAALAFRGIARRVTGEGLAPAALLVTTPAFLVLATTLLLDVPTLACMLLAVYALLRGADEDRARWSVAAGCAAAAAGLFKYVGMATAPLLAAGALLLCRRRGRALAWSVGIPLVCWGLWGAYTAELYGAPHFLAGAAFAVGRPSLPQETWNQLASLPIYYGAALLFPVLLAARALASRAPGSPLAVLGLLLGAAAAVQVLPSGFPPRRHPLEIDEALLAILAFAGAFCVWIRCLRPARWRHSRIDAFLALWLAGFGLFSLLVNWHVNAADALLAAPPALLLVYRTPELRPSGRAAWSCAALALAVSLLLAWAEMEQTGVYRETARRIAAEIGEQPGARRYFGNWGFQYYLEREGFRGIAPRDYGPERPPEPLRPGDWIAAARNLTHMDVRHVLDALQVQSVWTWIPRHPLPLRTNNPDAGAGFYSHHVGYVPWAFDTGPLEEIGLGRVTGVAERSR